MAKVVRIGFLGSVAMSVEDHRTLRNSAVIVAAGVTKPAEKPGDAPEAVARLWDVEVLPAAQHGARIISPGVSLAHGSTEEVYREAIGSGVGVAIVALPGEVFEAVSKTPQAVRARGRIAARGGVLIEVPVWPDTLSEVVLRGGHVLFQPLPGQRRSLQPQT
jgi:hypothetical protein